MPKRFWVVDDTGEKPLSAEEVRLNTVMIALNQLREGPKISKETALWARTKLAGGMLGEIIANPERFKWMNTDEYALVFWLLRELTSEVLTWSEWARLDDLLNNPVADFVFGETPK